MNDLLQLLVTAIATIATFVVVSVPLALVAMVPLPFVIRGSVRFQTHIAPRYGEVREKAGLVASQLAGNLGGIATVKIYAAEEFEAKRIAAESLDYVEANRRAIRYSAAFSPLIRMVIVVGFTTTPLFGGHMALRGELDVGAYALLTFLTQRLLWPFTRLGAILDLYQRGMASANRIFDLLATPIAVLDGPRRLPVGTVRGEIAFSRVVFAYRPGHPLLRDLSVRCPAGRTTAIVGATGGGKTTILKLLLRLYDRGAGGCTLDGSITLDGVEIREFALADLRRAIAIVSQDVFLFHGSVAENIAYGLVGTLDGASLDGVPRERIVAAVRSAEAEEFILRLPHGYDTIVGEREVLGTRIPAGGGADDLERLIDIVVAHPATARHVARRLVRTYVADPAPREVVAAVAGVFTETGGDIAARVRVAVRSACEVRGPARPIFKRPFRFLVSCLRGLGASTDGGMPLLEALRAAGHAPAEYPTPDGYPLEMEPWLGSLPWRWRLAADLARGRVRGTRSDPDRLIALAGSLPGAVAHLWGRAPDAEEIALLEGSGAPIAAALASPAFQWH